MLLLCYNYGSFLLQKKCFRYWPDFYSGFNDYGSLKVKLDKIINGSVFITRHIKISKKGSKDTRNVQHFQLLNWNQNKLPQSSEDFLDFVQEVEKSRNQTSLLAPLVVHGRYASRNFKIKTNNYFSEAQLLSYNHYNLS